MSNSADGADWRRQVALSRQLTLKNAVELLEFSSMYGAEQLQAACSQFICLNLAAVMENRWVPRRRAAGYTPASGGGGSGQCRASLTGTAR